MEVLFGKFLVLPSHTQIYVHCDTSEPFLSVCIPLSSGINRPTVIYMRL